MLRELRSPSRDCESWLWPVVLNGLRQCRLLSSAWVCVCQCMLTCCSLIVLSENSVMRKSSKPEAGVSRDGRHQHRQHDAKARFRRHWIMLRGTGMSGLEATARSPSSEGELGVCVGNLVGVVVLMTTASDGDLAVAVAKAHVSGGSVTHMLSDILISRSRREPIRNADP